MFKFSLYLKCANHGLATSTYTHKHTCEHMYRYTSTHVCTAFIHSHTYTQMHTHIDTSTSAQAHTHAQIHTTLTSQNTQRNNILFLSYHSLYTQIHTNSPNPEFCKTFFFHAFSLLIFLYLRWVGVTSLSLGYGRSVRQ